MKIDVMYCKFMCTVFRTNASTAMWGGAKAEGIDVCLDLLQIYEKKKIEVHT